MSLPNGGRFGICEPATRSIRRVSLFAYKELRCSTAGRIGKRFNFLPINKTPNSPADKKERTVCPQLSAIVVNVSTKKMCSAEYDRDIGDLERGIPCLPDSAWHCSFVYCGRHRQWAPPRPAWSRSFIKPLVLLPSKLWGDRRMQRAMLRSMFRYFHQMV